MCVLKIWNLSFYEDYGFTELGIRQKVTNPFDIKERIQDISSYLNLL